ncbi:DUF5590 domain-containing protein [Alkalihalobacillus hwajinpoensis]|uniref:cell wall elongation regulator TseB-like domain-containing protein n=1 Tax=Guptibacillus hwajinpoensis TaxID=208199 RepID=UPI001884465F|nr:DUF5590 domain-containing protein [Pseudalkalibacillus hwajinpoensis]MBF0708968.1 DUF5590 domain-containing protein [Pseudalkalibacillus hwajinpoensis]
MRVIGIIAGVILAVLIWQGISFYSSVTDQPDRLEEKAIERAESESVIEKVDEAVQYHGTNSAYVVLKGSDADGDQVYVFVPRKDGALVTKKIEDGVTLEAIKKKLSEEFSPQEVINIKPGIEINQEEKQVLVWEATFIDTNNRYTFAYYYFSNGEYWRSRSIKQS